MLSLSSALVTRRAVKLLKKAIQDLQSGLFSITPHSQMGHDPAILCCSVTEVFTAKAGPGYKPKLLIDFNAQVAISQDWSPNVHHQNFGSIKHSESTPILTMSHGEALQHHVFFAGVYARHRNKHPALNAVTKCHAPAS